MKISKASSTLFALALVAGCAKGTAGQPPAPCATAAQDYQGTVTAFFASTVGAIRRLPAVDNNPQLAAYADDREATICYVDGQISKGPFPPMTGTAPPSFDRAVIVVVDQNAILVEAGYQANIPIQSP